MTRLGPALAMLAAMYGGNTEPDEPHLAYPWWTLGMLSAIVIGAIFAEHSSTRPILWTLTAHLAAAGTVALVGLQLWRLVGLTGSGP